MTKDKLGAYAKAEAYLNGTLAYQAAIAVHHLKDLFGLEIEQLQLTVAPADPHHPGVVHVTCTLHALRDEKTPLEIRVAIDPRNSSEAL
jgi:hypothetical protein